MMMEEGRAERRYRSEDRRRTRRIQSAHPNHPFGKREKMMMEVEEGDEGGKGAMRTARRRLRQRKSVGFDIGRDGG